MVISYDFIGFQKRLNLEKMWNTLWDLPFGKCSRFFGGSSTSMYTFTGGSCAAIEDVNGSLVFMCPSFEHTVNGCEILHNLMVYPMILPLLNLQCFIVINSYPAWCRISSMV